MDLNCDMGELLPNQTTNFDEEMMPFITSCNIACGFHSGNPLIIEKTIKAALKHNVKIGVHPSYNDRANFGRISVDVSMERLLAELRYQIFAVKGMVENLGGKLNHIKPHGALYNDMVKNATLAKAVIRLIKSIDSELKIFALASSQVVDICESEGMKVVREGFADRRYQAVNQLRSRTLEGAVIHDTKTVLKQVDEFLNGKVTLWDSTICELEVDTICLHSDTKGAVELSREIFEFVQVLNN
ncbi:MAG: 5-oxoprolinase subunit PxpA [Saprospiraceae bacterium]